jgi:hypothetical protein
LPNNTRQHNPIKGLICGAAAGAMGAAVMDAYWWAVEGIWGARPEQAPKPGDQVPEDRHATQVMADRIAKALTGAPVPEEQKPEAGVAAHYAAGITFGAPFGALLSRRPLGLFAGLLYGALVWFAFNFAGIRLLGVAPEAEKVAPEQHAQALGAHLFYGVAVALATRVLLRIGS